MADKLRGHMDAGEYKHVVLGLIFLKYISDAFQERYEALKAEQIEEPLASLFDLKLAICTLDERRDLILRDNGFLKPEKPYIDGWRIQYFLVVPRHGCFQKNPSASLQ